MGSKKVLIIGDLHCGSMCGLTPPGWIVGKGRSKFFSELQEEMWESYVDILKHFGKVDHVVVNGDVIDGKGIRSGGTEQITSDMLEQTDMAIEALSAIDCKDFDFTYGTAYHTSSASGEDFDKIVAAAFNAPIEDELVFDAEGVVFNVKHKVNSTTTPYSRATPVGKHRLWDTLEAVRSDTRPADVYVRSHVHYFSFCGESKWSAFTLPALQASNTKYGARQCYGITDWGMCLFKVDGGVLAGWDCQMRDLKAGRTRIKKI